MDDVARHLGISKKTLYQYVSDKTELVSKVIDFDIKCKQEKFNKTDKKKLNAIEELFMVNRHVNKMLKEQNPSREYDLKKYYPEIYARFHTIKRDRMLESLKANIQKGKKEGQYRAEIDEDIITKLHVFRIENITEAEMFSVEEYTSPRFFKEIFIYHIRGMANEKGIKFLEQNIEKLNIAENE